MVLLSRCEIAVLVTDQQKLGWRNCLVVVLHRFAVSSGLYQRLHPVTTCPIPEVQVDNIPPFEFASQPWFLASRNLCLARADALLAGSTTLVQSSSSSN